MGIVRWNGPAMCAGLENTGVSGGDEKSSQKRRIHYKGTHAQGVESLLEITPAEGKGC